MYVSIRTLYIKEPRTLNLLPENFLLVTRWVSSSVRSQVAEAISEITKAKKYNIEESLSKIGTAVHPWECRAIVFNKEGIAVENIQLGNNPAIAPGQLLIQPIREYNALVVSNILGHQGSGVYRIEIRRTLFSSEARVYEIEPKAKLNVVYNDKTPTILGIASPDNGILLVLASKPVIIDKRLAFKLLTSLIEIERKERRTLYATIAQQATR